MNVFKLKKLYFSKKIPKADYIIGMFKFHKILYDYSDFIKGTDVKRIEITEDSVIITDRENIKLLCDKNDRRLVPIEILNFNSYEKPEMEMSYLLIEDGFHIFDIGANYGWYSLHFSKKFKKSKIFAFEPVPKTFSFLQKNIKLNNTLNIKAYNIGFSNKNEKKILYFRNSESGSASIADMMQENLPEEITCEMVRLDEFVTSNKLKIDFIKCDVEGAELFVFQGGLNSIIKYKPIIFAEMLRKWSAKLHYHPNKIIKMLEDVGYACYFIQDGKLIRLTKMTDETIQTNFFFLHLTKHKSKIDNLS